MSSLLGELGERLKLARLRRRHSAEQVAGCAQISRKTLARVEQGDPALALGIYARVLQVLRLEQDLALVGADDELVRKLQNAGLTPVTRRSILIEELCQRHQDEGPIAVELPPEELIREDRER